MYLSSIFSFLSKGLKLKEIYQNFSGFRRYSVVEKYQSYKFKRSFLRKFHSNYEFGFILKIK
jgi:hypothetical protein